jgi:putative serine/threonine protein kinase
VKLEDLKRTPFIQVLTYPKASLKAANSRLKQLRRLGVSGVVFEGKVRIGNLGILGLGTVGVVVRVTTDSGAEALKIRRTDANRPSMDEEFRLTSLANRIGVGVPVYGHSRDFILMKILDYQELYDWFGHLRGQGSRAAARSMIHSILNQCRKLDIMGVDHGQLSNLRKHVVVAEGRPWIIDFESAGTLRRPKNVTTAAQYLLIGGRAAPRVRRMLGVRDTSEILRLLGEYKQDSSDYTYSRLLELLKLD